MNYRLKKDGWHFRLQKWVLGNDIERMGNMCPYFWLTNFCIMIAPGILVGKILIKIMSVVGPMIDAIIKRKRVVEKVVKKRGNILYKIANYTKLFVLLPIGIVLIYLTYYIGIFIILVLEEPGAALIMWIILTTAALSTSLLYMFAASYNRDGWAPKFLKIIFSPLLYILRPIGPVFVFFGMNIKLLYKNYCPSIDWEN